MGGEMFSRRLLLVGTLLASTLVPAVAAADAARSWCVPGASKTRGASSDTTTNAVVQYVCDQSAFASCCDPSNGRWSVTCIQKGTEYLRKNSLGDVCGRAAWTQGPIAGTAQYYPRDFSLVALGDPANPTTPGNATSFYDSEGPIAAKKLIKSSSFNLNWGKRGRTALVAGESIELSNGTIHGDGYCGGSYTDPNLGGTIMPGHPIDFVDAATKLQNMSAALKQYPTNGTQSKPVNNTSEVVFTGTHSELNVFSVPSSYLTGVFTYTLNVPPESHVIINVTGTQPIIRSVGIRKPNGFGPDRILWNFPDATNLEISYTYLPGSVLAPRAQGLLQWGQVAGSVVIKNATPIWLELHWAPFQFEGSCGCLALDKSWSCSKATCLDDAGRASTIAAEAGFVEILGGEFKARNRSGTMRPLTSPTHRVWYSFHPAATAPESKPVAVLFNGGPGTSTSALLFSFNTGPKTLDPDRTGTAQVVTNNSSWTSFANLLYIDAPMTGFSYPLPYNGTAYPVGIEMDRDAGTVLRVLFRFLAHHPALQRNPVILVGESYGGPRATLMLEHLLDYQHLDKADTQIYYDHDLYLELTAHLSAVFPGQTVWPPATIATQFSHQILIQPVVAGSLQGSAPAGYDSVCVAAYEDLECNKALPWRFEIMEKVANRLVNPATLTQALGVDVTTIDWMKAAFRTEAYGRNVGEHIPNDGLMITPFGALNKDKGDNYFVETNSVVIKGYDANSRDYRDTSIGTSFLQNVKYVTTFITNARYDLRVYTPGLVPAFNDPTYGGLIEPNGVVWNSIPDPTFVRPGWLNLTYKAGIANPQQRNIRFPTYLAGHSVSVQGHKELLADVVQWYQLPQASYLLQGGASEVRQYSPVVDPYTGPLSPLSP